MPDKNLICTLCPQGCLLTLELKNGLLEKTAGNNCPRGLEFARQEITDPRRTLTSSVLCSGLSVKMLPVKTSRPIAKAQLLTAMEAIKKIKVSRPVQIGEVLAENFTEEGINLIATREI